MIPPLLDRLAARQDLTRDEMEAAVGAFMADPPPPDAQIAAFLMALRVKGESVAELVGAAAAMRARAVRLPLATPPRLDTAGTGGDGSGSLNLSTAAALVAAAGGVSVAKHGNRSISSRCGSSDVLEAMGIPIDLPPAAAAAAITNDHFAFLFAPAYHPATKAVAGVRRALGVRTLFNILGPLTNPAFPETQMIGVFAPERAAMMAEALRDLGAQRALVVSAEIGLDEIAPEGATLVHELEAGRIRTYRVTPDDFGLAPAPVASIKGGDAAFNAATLRAVLGGVDHPARTGVLLNAAAALYTAGAVGGFAEGARRAAALIDGGAVAALLTRLTGAVPA